MDRKRLNGEVEGSQGTRKKEKKDNGQRNDMEREKLQKKVRRGRNEKRKGARRKEKTKGDRKAHIEKAVR